jgi:hypothetical protein
LNFFSTNSRDSLTHPAFVSAYISQSLDKAFFREEGTHHLATAQNDIPLLHPI